MSSIFFQLCVFQLMLEIKLLPQTLLFFSYFDSSNLHTCFIISRSYNFRLRSHSDVVNYSIMSSIKSVAHHQQEKIFSSKPNTSNSERYLLADAGVIINSIFDTTLNQIYMMPHVLFDLISFFRAEQEQSNSQIDILKIMMIFIFGLNSINCNPSDMLIIIKEQKAQRQNKTFFLIGSHPIIPFKSFFLYFYTQKFIDHSFISLFSLRSKSYFYRKICISPRNNSTYNAVAVDCSDGRKIIFFFVLLSDINGTIYFHGIQSLNNSKRMSKMDKSRKNAKISIKRRQALIRFVEQEGNTIRYAAHKLNIKPSTAQQIMKKYKETGKIFSKIMVKGKKETSASISHDQHKQQQYDNQIPSGHCNLNLVLYDQQAVRSHYEALIMQQSLLFWRNLQYQSIGFYPILYQ